MNKSHVVNYKQCRKLCGIDYECEREIDRRFENQIQQNLNSF